MSAVRTRRTLVAVALCCGLTAASVAQAQIKISQIFGGGNNQGSLFDTDYIELHNTSGSAVDFAATPYSIHYRATTGTTWTKITINVNSIPAGGYYLIRTQNVPATPAYLSIDIPAPDLTSASPDMAATAGVLALYDAGTTVLTNNSACPPAIASGGGTLVDLIGWGTTTTCSEPTTTPSTANTAQAGSNQFSMHRRLCGAGDGNNNGSDVFVGLPNPRNSATVAAVGLGIYATASPSIIRAGDPATIVAIPRNCTGGAVLGASVTANLTAIGGVAAQSLFDDGTNGDEVPGDGYYSFFAIVNAATSAGTKSLPVTVAAGGNSGGAYASIVVTAAGGPINDSCLTAAAIAPTGTPGTPDSYTPAGVVVTGNLTGAREEYNTSSTNFINSSGFPSMNGGSGGKRGLWYTVIGTGTTMTAETCGTASSFDSIIQVLCGTCDGLSVISAGDDECGSLARATWCSIPGQIYYIWTSHFANGAQTNTFSLRISDNNALCSNARSCTTCVPTCISGATSEGETAAGPSMNDGCDASTVAGATAHVFTDVSVTSSVLNICGASRAYGAGSSTIGVIDNDWYRFQASVSDTFGAVVSAQFPVILQLRQLSATGTCSTNTLMTSATGERCATASVNSSLSAGTWYAIRVAPNLPSTAGAAGNNSGFALGATSNSYILSMQLGIPTAPSCSASASPTSVMNDGASSTTFTVTVTPGTNPPSVDHIVTANLTNIGGSAAEPMVEGPPNTFTLTYTVPNTTTSGSKLVSFTTQEISPLNRSSTCSLNLTITQAPPPNDTCANAILVSCGSATPGTTVAATLDAGLPSCASVAPSALNVSGATTTVTGPGVWYRITGNGQTVTADVLTASYDTKLSVFTGADCTDLTCVTMNDDIRADFHSKVAFQTIPLQDYWILVHGFSTSFGTFTLNVVCDPTPANDNCADATPIGGAVGTSAGTIAGATASLFTQNSSVLATCANNANHPLFDVWYALTACSTGTLTLDTCGTYDTLLSVHSACHSLTLGNQIAGACNDNGPSGCTSGSQLTLAVTEGTVYLIRVAGNIGQNVGAPFILTWSLPDVTPPTITACADDQAVIADVLCEAIVPDFTTGVVATDNCGTPTITQSPPAGSTVTGAGLHVITITATDGSSNTDTCTANLNVADPLVIATGPQDVTSCVGGMASFSVTANFAAGYQWRHNTNPLSDGGSIGGATTSTLTINPLIAADAGVYDCVVTSVCGGDQTSTPASLTVNASPSISTQPVGGSVGVGSPFSFTVGANGGGLSYQWYLGVTPLVDDSNISGATSPTLNIASATLADAGSYTVIVSNNCGSITSDPAVLIVNYSATVSLVAPPCVNGSQLVVDVLMSSAPAPIVGGQFFLAYDNTVLDFVSATPGDAPFLREVYEVVSEPAGEINYAVGINDGDSGTMTNTVMARLTFNIIQNVCILTPNLVTWRASGPNGAENKLSDDQGQQVDINDVNLGNVRLDNVAPVITVCPSTINVHAAPGSCNSAPVTYSAAATDNCTASPTITFNPPSGSSFAPGTTPVLVTATDECGNSSTCTFNVINDGMVEMNVEVELGGGVMAAGTFTRAITFALWNTTVDNVNPLHTTCVTMSFSGAPKLGSATLLVPCQPTGYDCITARDRLHTLRRTISPIPITGLAYTPSFTTAKALIGGNLDDSKFIDILDFGIYTTQDLTVAPGGANTVCGQNPPGVQHADINGNGVVNSLDYSFIANNFLMTREDNCNGSTITIVTADGGGARDRDLPITSITINQLHERGLGNLAVMDLNQDGIFDLTDKGLWEQGVRPNTGGTSAPVGGVIKPSQPQNLGSRLNPMP